MPIGDTNRASLRWVRETTWGTTPTTPTLWNLRFTGESLNGNIQNIQSEEIRSDRMISDLIQVDLSTAGDINMEMSYGNADTLIEGSMHSAWSDLFGRDNNRTSTEITAVAAASITVSNIATSLGTNVKQYSLIHCSGFTNSGNNRLIIAGTGSTATSIVIAGGTIEASPPVTAKVQLCGFSSSAAADIQADANGLICTATNFTNFGLVVGQWIKIGGTGTNTFFSGTAANNGWARIVSISTTALVLDNKPTGWSVDTAAGKLIQVFHGNYLRNGTTIAQNQFTVERELTDITQFFAFKGMRVNSLNFNLATGQIMTCAASFMGKNVVRTGATVATTTKAALTADVMNAASDAVVVNEGGTSAGIVRSMTIQTNNNLREQKAVGTLGNAGMGSGVFEVTGSLEAYFQDGTLYDKYTVNAATSLACVFVQDNQAYVLTVPRVKIESCSISAGGRNQDMILNMSYRGIMDTATNCELQIERFPYYQ